MNALKVLQVILSAQDVPVYPVAIPQTARLPCVVTSMVSERANTRLDDAFGQYEAICRVSCHGATPGAAVDLGEAIKTLLMQTTQASIDGGNVLSCCFKGTVDFTDYDDDRTVFRRVMDFRIQWWPQ
jgi:hypothetical protein